MRDQRKNADYFARYLAYADAQIKKGEGQLHGCPDAAQRQAILLPLCKKRLQVLIASFSAGADAKRLRTLLDNAAGDYSEKESITYFDLLMLLSFAVILEDKGAAEKLHDAFADQFSDALFHGLYSFAVSGQAEWTGEFMVPAYGNLAPAIHALTQKEQEQKLLDYLTQWYDLFDDSAWHGTCDSKHDTYYGYWAFEAAAVAKACGLDTAHLSANEFFPVL